MMCILICVFVSVNMSQCVCHVCMKVCVMCLDAEEGGIDSLLPLPSFRESVVCPFELRRFRLAVRGRALLREAECPLGIIIMCRVAYIRLLARLISSFFFSPYVCACVWQDVMIRFVKLMFDFMWHFSVDSEL